MDGQRRTLGLESLQEVCSYREWGLLAAHVRLSHVHLVVVAEDSPERVLKDAKAYASRALNRAGWTGRINVDGRVMAARATCGSRSR